MKKYSIPIAIVIAGVLVAGTFFYLNQNKEKIISSQEAAEKAIAFINQSIQDQGVTASLIDVFDEGEVFRIHLKIAETEYDSYMTKSGKFLFPSGYNLEEQSQEETPAEAETPSYANLNDFAKCLTDNGMKFYGSNSCPWCAKEKEAFGDSLQYIAYIECVDETTGGWAKECQEAKIESVPTWQLPDGKMESGYKTLEQLAEVSGCLLQ